MLIGVLLALESEIALSLTPLFFFADDYSTEWINILILKMFCF